MEIFGVSASQGQLQLSFVVWHLGQQSQEAVSFKHQKQHVQLVADSWQVVQQLHKPLTLDSLQIEQHVQFPCSSRVLFVLQVLQRCANPGHSQFLTWHLQMEHLGITGYSLWKSLAFLGNTFDFQAYLSEEHGWCLPSELPKDVGVSNPVVLKQGLIRTLLLTHNIRGLRFVGRKVLDKASHYAHYHVTNSKCF